MDAEILDKIIQDGLVIRTQIGKNAWESSIIISHNQDIIQINLAEDHYKMAIMSGDSIICKYHFDGTEYLMEGRVKSVTIREIPSIYIKVTDIKTYKSKRRNERLDVRLGANVWLEGKDHFIYCVINNLSNGGLGLVSRTDLGAGNGIKVDILIDYKHLLSVKGYIVREQKVDDYFEIGFIANEGDLEGLENLRKTIEKYHKVNEKMMEDVLEKVRANRIITDKEQTVMIVDDNVFTRLIMKKLLSLNGYSKILEVADGPQAISFAQKLKPEIIILDIILPTLNGNEAIDEILNVSPGSKVIVVSTVGSKRMIEEMKAKGASDYLVKPFNHDQLIDIINKISAS